MRAGFFETDITPALGMERPGGYGKAYCDTLHDPLKVRAAVFDDGDTAAALVGIDSCMIEADTVHAARQRICKRCGVPVENIMIGASHTHSGGPLPGPFPEDVADASELVRTLVLEQSIVGDPFYREWVIGQIETAVCEAHRRCVPVTCSVGSGSEAEAVHNRRFHMKSGRVCSHPGKGNPDILGPAGPIDPEVGVLAAWTAGGQLAGCVVNYACHGTTGPGGVSADWIHYLEQTIRGVMGEDAVVVFLNGACGDVTQVDNLSLRARESGESVARTVGTRVGAEVLKVLTTAARDDLTPVRVCRRTLRIPRRPPSAKSLERARKLFEDTGQSPERSSAERIFAKERLVLEHMISQRPEIDAEVQAVQIGPALFLSNPAEYFCSLGLRIKKESPFPFTYVVELANGSIGYVPDTEAFAADGGGYETVLTSYANLVPEAGNMIADASIELANKLRPGLVPSAETVAGPQPVWDYGNLGPELE